MVIVMKIADIVQGVVDSSSPASLSVLYFSQCIRATAVVEQNKIIFNLLALALISTW